jgi:2,3-dihydroxybenzoate decarboxylase
MKYIALEEAFAIPDLAQRQPKTTLKIRVSPELAKRGQVRLADFTEYRLPEMDANGIDIQVLSLTVPGIQADVDPRTATDNAVYANDFLAVVVAQHPDRFKGFAALPMHAAALGRPAGPAAVPGHH